MIRISDISVPKNKRSSKLLIRKDADKYANFCKYLAGNNIYLDNRGFYVNENGEQFENGELLDYVIELLERDLIIENNYTINDVINAIYEEHLLNNGGWHNELEKRYLRNY